MKAELVFNNLTTPLPITPSVWKAPKVDQMQGTAFERLVELCGRGCYDSLGTGRGSAEYHKHLLDVVHYSVHEHVHATIETDLPACVWHGIPDYSLIKTSDNKNRITFNLRHCLEWPNNVVYYDQRKDTEEIINRWGNLLRDVAHHLMPNVLPPWNSGETLTLMIPEHDTEQFVSVFLEDSRVWSHEQVRHRFNMSQRSGRFVDETDRADCIHPLFREYLNEAGYLALDPGDGPTLWTSPHAGCSTRDIQDRTKIGNLIGSYLAQGKMIYSSVVESLQPWLMNRGLDAPTARKQARSAARYYLGNGLSTEMIFTASVRNWRGIFGKRCNPAADAAIFELMGKARRVIEDSLIGSSALQL